MSGIWISRPARTTAVACSYPLLVGRPDKWIEQPVSPVAHRSLGGSPWARYTAQGTGCRNHADCRSGSGGQAAAAAQGRWPHDRHGDGGLRRQRDAIWQRQTNGSRPGSDGEAEQRRGEGTPAWHQWRTVDDPNCRVKDRSAQPMGHAHCQYSAPKHCGCGIGKQDRAHRLGDDYQGIGLPTQPGNRLNVDERS
jgi:hypothetical protein